jgi:hypothetical protein
MPKKQRLSKKKRVKMARARANCESQIVPFTAQLRAHAKAVNCEVLVATREHSSQEYSLDEVKHVSREDLLLRPIIVVSEAEPEGEQGVLVALVAIDAEYADLDVHSAPKSSHLIQLKRHTTNIIRSDAKHSNSTGWSGGVGSHGVMGGRGLAATGGFSSYTTYPKVKHTKSDQEQVQADVVMSTSLFEQGFTNTFGLELMARSVDCVVKSFKNGIDAHEGLNELAPPSPMKHFLMACVNIGVSTEDHRDHDVAYALLGAVEDDVTGKQNRFATFNFTKLNLYVSDPQLVQHLVLTTQSHIASAPHYDV